MVLIRLGAASLIAALLSLLFAPASPSAQAERQGDPCALLRFRDNPNPLPPDRPNRFGRRRNSHIA